MSGENNFKIGFYNILGEPKNGEMEALMRLKYSFAKLKTPIMVIDRGGYILSPENKKGQYIEDVPVDFIFTCDTLDFALSVLPDVPAVFMHWAPLSFMANFQALAMLKGFSMYDCFSCSSEKEIFSRDCRLPVENMALIGPSVPQDFAVKPQFQKNRKLFYVGINFERVLTKMRYGTLLKALDDTNKLEIYGPKKVYGTKNLWAGFQSYQGEIPFDGRTIMEKINQAGVCLALNSPMHNDANAVTSRTYEAAAAGAVIISDDNEFVHQYFGDSVFYIERELSEKEASEKILNILDWVNEHPEEAYEMACRSQQVFFDHLTLDKMVSDFVDSTEKAIAKVHDKSLQTDVIDVLCFLDETEDYARIMGQLNKQYYQNLHLIFVGKQALYDGLRIDVPHDFVAMEDEYKGRAFVKAKELLRGKYFMFMDKHSVLHARHIYKNHEVISNREELFAYSGSYLKTAIPGEKQYIVLNNKPIVWDEFLLFSNASSENVDWKIRDKQSFWIETIFSRSAVLFDRSILEFVQADELSFISEAVHYYLACCSLIKAGKLGRFTHALTTGYKGNSVEEMEKVVFADSRKHWLSNGRSAKTYIKEMNEIFFKYTFESNPTNILLRNMAGEITWYNETPKSEASISIKRKFVRVLKKFTPKYIKEFIKKCVYA